MSSKWHETRKARMDGLFSGKKYSIVKEFRSDTPIATPLGYKVNSGYELSDGEETIVVGKALLHQLASDYNAVEEPAPKKRGRPKKSVVEQAETWAARDIPDDAQQISQPGATYTNPNANQEF